MAQVGIEGGCSFEVRPGDTVLKAALRSGVGFPYECSVGSCGSCRFELLHGEIRTLWEEAPGLGARDRRLGRRLACQSIPAGDVGIRVRLDAACVPSVRPRPLAMALEARRPLTHDMVEFSFRSPEAATFTPGQYALLQLPGDAGQRAYSMSNLPNADGLWQFIIRRVPRGQGTAWLFDGLAVGEQVVVDGPYGLAGLRPVQRDLVCIAGGSGLAPMLSIARAAAAALEGAGRHLRFYYGGRTPRDMAAAPFLRGLGGTTGRLSWHEIVSHPAAEDCWDGRVGFVHDAVAEDLGASLADHEVYLAGPPPMVLAAQEMLMVRHNVPHGQIHFDRFF